MFLIPVSVGEIVDKITILKIKSRKIKEHRAAIKKEISILQKTIKELKIPIELIGELQKVNELLWEVENDIRAKEKCFRFDDDFIDLARSVYQFNNRRSEIKSEINLFAKSEIKEYKKYN